MPEDVYVDLTYQGIELGTGLCMAEFTESEAYIQCPHPMPVGSALVVKSGDGLEVPVRVARVSEQVAGTEQPAGMFVGATELDGQAREWWMANAGASSASPAAPAPVDVRDTEPTAEAPAEAPPPKAEPPEAEQQAAAASQDAASEPEAPNEAKPTKKKRRRRKKR